MQDIEDPFEEGKRRLEQGDIPSAVLCFESACQANPENSLAWQFLGTSQAENEQVILLYSSFLLYCLHFNVQLIFEFLIVSLGSTCYSSTKKMSCLGSQEYDSSHGPCC